MADHPVENTIEIIVTDGGTPSGSSPNAPLASSAGAPPLSDETISGKSPQPRDAFGRFKKRASAAAGGASGGSGGGGRTPPPGPPPPVPPPPPSTSPPPPDPGHPDDPPPGMWRDITDPNLRRRLWRAHRQRVHNSFAMEERAQRAEARRKAAVDKSLQNVPPNFQPHISPQQRVKNWKNYQKNQRAQAAALNRQQRQSQQAAIRQQNLQARRQRQRRRLLQGVPKTFQPNVRNARQRRQNWINYQKGLRQQAAANAQQQRQNNQMMVSWQKQQQRQKKQAARQAAINAARAAAGRASFGRSVGSSIGAGLGAKVGGPWGAAAGSYFGGMVGGRLTAAVSSPALAAAGAAIGGAVIASYGVKKIHDTYDAGHKAFNRAISDGVVPFTKSLASAVPVIGNFIGTWDAVQKRFAVDSDRYRNFSPRLASQERIEDAWTMMNRIGNAQRMVNGNRLDNQMSEMAALRGRLGRAGEGIEAAASRELYQLAIPFIRKATVVMEMLEKQAPEIAKSIREGVENLAKKAPETFMTVLKAEILRRFPIFGSTINANVVQQGANVLNDVGQAAKLAIKKFEQQKAQEHKQLADLLNKKVLGNLSALGRGTNRGDLTPLERDALKNLMGKPPDIPPGLGNLK